MRLTLDHAAIGRMLRDKNGSVGRDINHRATNVQLAARSQVGVLSGRLRRGLVKRGPEDNDRGSLSVFVGSEVDHALLHHEGTRPHVILPVKAKMLHFKVGGVDVFVHQVNHPGTRPNHYLTDNLKEALR